MSERHMLNLIRARPKIFFFNFYFYLFYTSFLKKKFKLFLPQQTWRTTAPIGWLVKNATNENQLIDCSFLSSFYESIHPSIYLSIHPSIHPSTHESIHPSIHPFIYLCLRYFLLIYLFIYLFL